MKRSMLTAMFALVLACIAAPSTVHATPPSVQKTQYRVEMKEKGQETWKHQGYYAERVQAEKARELLLVSQRYREVRILPVPVPLSQDLQYCLPSNCYGYCFAPFCPLPFPCMPMPWHFPPMGHGPISHPIIVNPPVGHGPISHPIIVNPPTTRPPFGHPIVVNPPAPVVVIAPVGSRPVHNAPVTTEPVHNAPVTSHPVHNAPVTTEPVHNAPVTSHPVHNAPTHSGPVHNKR
jgi:hypothetical protein